MTDTPTHGHAPIPMRRQSKGCESLEKLGDFYWDVRGERRTLVVLIPCLSGRSGWINSRWTIDHKNHCDAQWSWDGNEDAPTLDPTLDAGGIWHGWCRKGQLEEA